MAKKITKEETPTPLVPDAQEAPAGSPVEDDRKYIGADGELTSDEFSVSTDPNTGQEIRRPNKPRGETHGAIRPDPYEGLDYFGRTNEDAGPREVKSPQASQLGEDPGRVFDSAGLHPEAAAQYQRLRRQDPVHAQRVKLDKQRGVPSRPTDTPGTTAALASDAAQKTPPSAGPSGNPVVPSGAVPSASAPPPERTPILNPETQTNTPATSSGEPTIT